jgi:hypothetical protein
MYQATEELLSGSADFRWLYDYLVSKTGGSRMPDRRDIDPAEMKHLLTAINLVDLIRDGEAIRLRYRLVGSLQSYFFAGDRNVTGHFIDEFWGPDPTALDAIHSEYQRAIDQLGPIAGAYRHSKGKHDYMRYQRAIYPLTNGGNRIGCFICLHAYESRDISKGHDDLNRNPISRKKPPPMSLDR